MELTIPTLDQATTNALFYGPSGSGKTTAAGTACNDKTKPDLLVLNTEGGGWQSIVHGLGYTPYVQNIANKKELVAAYDFIEKGVKAGTLPIKTVVLDSLTDLSAYLLEDIIASTSRRRPAQDVACKEDYNELAHVLKKMLRRFRDLDLNVILIATDKVVGGGNDSNDVVEVLPNLPGQVARLLPALVDVSLYTGTVEVEPSPAYPEGMRYVGQTVPLHGRHCKIRGVRGVPRVIDNHWGIIARAFGREEGLPMHPELRTLQTWNGTLDSGDPDDHEATEAERAAQPEATDEPKAKPAAKAKASKPKPDEVREGVPAVDGDPTTEPTPDGEPQPAQQPIEHPANAEAEQVPA